MNNRPKYSENLAQMLMRAFLWVDEGLQNRLQSRGWPHLSRAQSLVFVNIGEGVLRPSDIAQKMGVTRQAVHQTINELVQSGFVSLENDPNDKRAKIVSFTEVGFNLASDALKSLREVEAELAARLGEQLVAQLREALLKEWGAPVGER